MRKLDCSERENLHTCENVGVSVLEAVAVD